jgi:hypothetical protein
MALDFPNSPSNGEIFSDGTRSWQYDGTVWNILPMEGASTSEPMGFPNRTDSTLSFSNVTRTITLGIASGSTHFDVWNKGKRYRYTAAQSVQLPDTSGLWYIYINSSGEISYKNTFFDWENDTPVSYIYWNATDQVQYFFADERHGIVLDWQTHEYLHRTRGAVIANGFGAANYVTDGDGSSDSHAEIDIANGTFFDEDLQVDIVHSATPTSNTWEQFLQGPAQIPVMYRSGSVWVKDNATDFPMKAGTSLPRYNSVSGSTWGLTDVGNSKFGVSWVAATNNLNNPIISIMGQEDYNTIGAAEAAQWDQLDLSGFPVVEFRVLYKIVFQAATGYSNTIKAAIRGVYDLRRISTAGESIPAVPVSDHGSLTGLADDDHTQYPKLTNSDTAPSSPRQNDMWYDTTNGRTYVYYDSYWVEMGSGSGEIFLDNISDVNAGSPSDGEILTYSSSTGVWEPELLNPMTVSLLPVDTYYGYQVYYAGGNTYATVDQNVACHPAWTPAEDCLLDSWQVGVHTAVVDATLNVALYECDRKGTPGDKVADLGLSVDCSVGGSVTVTGLAIPVSRGTVYRLATEGGPVSPLLRGISAGTGGFSTFPIGTGPFALNFGVSDNLQRVPVWRTDNLDPSPTWSLYHIFVDLPNIWFKLVPSP